MDDLRVITELRPDAPLPQGRELAAAKGRLMAEFETASRAKRPGRRYAWLAGAGAIAAAAAVAFVVVPSTGPAQPKATPAVQNAAALLLDQAAQDASTQPALTPRPDQFVYFKTQAGNQPDQEWLSVDGTRDGLIRDGGEDIPLPGCVNGKQPEVFGTKVVPGHSQPCQPVLAYDPNLPTDPNALISYLEGGRAVDLTQASGVNEVAKDIDSLFSQSYVSPAVQSALFTAIARIPGLSVDHDTPAGTVGIKWSFSGSAEMLFSTNGNDHRYVGSKTVSEQGDVGISQLLQVGIVDKVGELPA